MANDKTSGIQPVARLAIVALLFLPSCSPSEPASDPEPDLAELEKEVEVYPTPAGLVELSLAYQQEGAPEKSVEAAEEAIRLDPRGPNSARAYNNVCVARALMGQWDAAIDACEKALALEPGLQLARNNLAWAKSGRESAGE